MARLSMLFLLVGGCSETTDIGPGPEPDAADAPDGGLADGVDDNPSSDASVTDRPTTDRGPGLDSGPGDAGMPPVASQGIWISREEIAALPMSGSAWQSLLDAANGSAGTPDVSNQDQDNNVLVLAKAIVFVRTSDERYRTEVRSQCMAAIGTEVGGRTLALGRELLAYVVAADLVGLEASEDSAFRAWLRDTLTETLDGRTLVETHEERPNNWGTHAGASRAAVAVYLGDRVELERTALVFQGWLGDRSAYAMFSYGDLSWQADASAPVGVNPRGAERDGVSIDGAQPEEMRRGCAFQTPPCTTGYAWEALQGAVAQAEILWRQGFETYSWSDQAILRSVQYLYNLDSMFGGWAAESDDTWIPWIINYRYGTTFPADSPANAGKNMGYADWTHDTSTRTGE